MDATPYQANGSNYGRRIQDSSQSLRSALKILRDYFKRL